VDRRRTDFPRFPGYPEYEARVRQWMGGLLFEPAMEGECRVYGSFRLIMTL
jgi:hypothetical protein